VLLIGGAGASAAVRRIAPEVFGTDVDVPASGEYVALGAARQAAWALSGGQSPPQWMDADTERFARRSGTPASPSYATLRDETASWKSHR
ncbi:MAG TPA: xylulose kinase, partial [Stackebrandtia sp.]|nr:xylulose kinase [Stackebrandtia sp.]